MAERSTLNIHTVGQTMGQTRIILTMLLLVVAAYAHNLFHEFGHWLAGTMLGNQMGMNLNYVWVIGGGYLREWHSPIVGIAGPLCSILMAFVAFLMIRKYRTIYAVPFLFGPFVARLFALTLGGFAQQDEAGVAASLGMGKYTVAVLVLTILGALVLQGSYTLKLRFLDIGAWSLGSVTAKLLVIATIRLLM